MFKNKNIIYILILGVFCIATGFSYLQIHGGWMYCIAGIDVLIGEIFIALAFFAGEKI